MKDRIKKVLFGVVAVGAMALGGSAIAGAVTPNQGPSGATVPATGVQVPTQDTGATPGEAQGKAGKPAANEKADGPEKNDATEKAEGPEKPDANEKAEGGGADTDNVQDENGKDDASESGSESANDDGPGGHADEKAGAIGGAANK